MRNALSVLLLVTALSSPACLGSGPVTEDASWGVGEDPGCDPTAEHCWPEADRATLTGIRNDVNEIVGVAAQDRNFKLRAALGRTRELDRNIQVVAQVHDRCQVPHAIIDNRDHSGGGVVSDRMRNIRAGTPATTA